MDNKLVVLNIRYPSNSLRYYIIHLRFLLYPSNKMNG